MQTLIALLFQILLRLVPIFFKNLEEKTELKKRVIDKLREYEYKHADDMAVVREKDLMLDVRLKEAWQEKWGTEEGAPSIAPTLPPPPLPLVPSAVFEAPSTVRAGQEFVVRIGLELLGSVVRCDGAQLNFFDEHEASIALTKIGERFLELVFEGKVIATTTVKVIA